MVISGYVVSGAPASGKYVPCNRYNTNKHVKVKSEVFGIRYDNSAAKAC